MIKPALLSFTNCGKVVDLDQLEKHIKFNTLQKGIAKNTTFTSTTFTLTVHNPFRISGILCWNPGNAMINDIIINGEGQLAVDSVPAAMFVSPVQLKTIVALLVYNELGGYLQNYGNHQIHLPTLNSGNRIELKLTGNVDDFLFWGTTLE